MDKNEKKEMIIHSLTKMECVPIKQKEVEIQEYNQIPIGQLSSMGATISSIVPTLHEVIKNAKSSNVGEGLYRMIDPTNGRGMVTTVGNIYEKGKRGVVARARYVKVGASSVGSVAQINPAIMLMTIAISAITKKLDNIAEAQKDIIQFLQLKEKSVLKGNIAVLHEILNEYKYNWENEKYKNNKHIQVQEIKRDAEQGIVFFREQIQNVVAKKGLLHSDRDVKSKIQKLQYEFKDYELAMYIFAFSSFLEVMLLENFDAGYLGDVINKIEMYSNMYRELHGKCRELMFGESKTSVQAYILKGVAGFNKAIGKGISKIPKISDGQMDETLIDAGQKVELYNDKRAENTIELFVKEDCACVQPFVDNLCTISMIYNEPIDLLFDNENIYFKLINA